MGGRRRLAVLVVLLVLCVCAALSPRVFLPSALAARTTYESRHYTIVSDLDRELTLDLATRADAMYEEYARRLADFSPPGGPPQRFELRLFQRRSDYLALAGNRFINSGGIFLPGRNLLAAYLEEQGRDNLRRVLQHEAFHQFAHTNISPNLPNWLNEGLAQVFEEAIFVNGQFLLGEIPPRRHRQLEYDMQQKRLIPFRTLLTMSHQDWQQAMRDEELTSTIYNQSWAMVHFLIFATDPRQPKVPLYRAQLIEWLRRMHVGEEPNEAFAAAYSDNIEGFQSRFVEWARSMKPTPQACVAEHQQVLADLLRELYGKRTFKSVAEFRQEIVARSYRIHYTHGSIKWTTADNPSIYFADLRGRAYRAEQLTFEPRPGAPLPDLVCRPDDCLPMRTRFHLIDGKVERETLVEPPARR